MALAVFAPQDTRPKCTVSRDRPGMHMSSDAGQVQSSGAALATGAGGDEGIRDDVVAWRQGKVWIAGRAEWAQIRLQAQLSVMSAQQFIHTCTPHCDL